MSFKRNTVFAALMVSALTVAGLAAMPCASATPLSLVDHGSYTTDTATNLNWLDLSATYGLSYNQVMGNSGVNYIAEGWRYATSSELATLFTDAGGSGLLLEHARYGVLGAALARRHDEERHPVAGRHVPQQCPGAAKLDVVGVSADRQHVHEASPRHRK